jgi:hypothetical protein
MASEIKTIIPGVRSRSSRYTGEGDGVIAEPLLDLGREIQDRDGERQAHPQPVPEHLRTVPFVLVVTLMAGMTGGVVVVAMSVFHHVGVGGHLRLHVFAIVPLYTFQPTGMSSTNLTACRSAN